VSSCGTARRRLSRISGVRENPWLQLQQRHRVLVSNQFREARRGPQSANALRNICNQPPEFVVACARRSTGRGGSSRRLLGCRWRHGRGRSRSRRGRGRSRSRAWFTATVHHAHFSSAALADRGTHLGIRYADAIDQLTAQTTSLANWNDRTVRLLKWGVRHTLCWGHNAQRERNDGGSDHRFLSSVTESLCR
jgi:hypothetical protein